MLLAAPPSHLPTLPRYSFGYSWDVHKQVILDCQTHRVACQCCLSVGRGIFAPPYLQKINPGCHSSRRQIDPQRMPWFIDYAYINNTAIMLAGTQTLIYRDGACESEVEQKTGK